MEKTVVLLTGVTGFVGSTLAAVMLRSGYHIVSLSRNDQQGARTRAKIKESYQGFFPMDTEDALDEMLQKNVDVLPYDYQLIRAHEDLKNSLRNVKIVWHCAAEMSFSFRKSVSTFNGNVGMAAGLYQLITEFAPSCRRFFYVSTAYTSGNSREIHGEELHFSPEHVNPYQMSKWAAEMSLSAAQKVHGLPVTIFRPSVVVGHSENGFYNGQSFGIYAYAHLYQRLQQLGIKKVHLEAASDTTIDVVPINLVADCALTLTAMSLVEKARGEAFQIVHASGTAIKTSEIAAGLQMVFGVQTIMNSKPKSALDHSLDQILSIYKRFNSDNIRFDNAKMRHLVGEDITHRPVDVSTLSLYFQNTSTPDSKLLNKFSSRFWNNRKLQPLPLMLQSVNYLSKSMRKVEPLQALIRSLGSRLKIVFI